MATNTSDMGESQPSATGASGTLIDWAAEFQLTEFLSGLQTVLAGMANSMPRPDQLEQFGDSIPSQPTTSRASAPGNLSVAQGMFNAPFFVSAISGSVPEASSSIPPPTPQPSLSVFHPTNDIPSATPAPNIPNPNRGSEKTFSLGPGRAPIPPKLVSRILSDKFIELTELLPENLDEPLSDTTSFAIEGSTIVPVSRSSRERKSNMDILLWVECFNSYVSVIVTFQPHRAHDLLAYMALIIRTAKSFGSRAWSQYDRTFRCEVEVNNLQDWSVIRIFHTAAIYCIPDAEPIGNPTV